MTTYRIPYNLHDHCDHARLYAPQHCHFDIEAESQQQAITVAYLRRTDNRRIGKIQTDQIIEVLATKDQP